MDMTLFIVLAALFIYVLVANEITRLHRSYLVFHFLMMMWPFFIYLVNMTPNLRLEWIFLKIAFIGISFSTYAWFIFSLVLIGSVDRYKRSYLWLASLPAIFSAGIAALNPGNAFVLIGGRGWSDHIFGPLFWVLILIQVIYIFAATGHMLWARLKTGDKMVKDQLSLCLTGCAFFVFFAIADILINIVINARTVIPALTSMGTVLAMVCFIVAITNYDLVRIFSVAQREIIDNMAVGIVFLNNKGIIVGKNHSADRFFNLEPGQAFGLDRLLAAVDDQEFKQNFTQPHKKGEFKTLQTEVTLGDSPKRRVLINVGKIESDNKKVLGRIITLTDITEINTLLDRISLKNQVLKEQNEELTRMQEELFRMELSRRNLLSNISHDLRSPMTHIQGYLQAMVEGIIDDPEQQKQYLKMIYSKAVLLTRLIDDLFHLSQLESRQVSYELGLMPAQELVRKCFADCELEARSAGVNIDLWIQPLESSQPEAYPMVNVDADRIGQVFVNLVSNAIKHVGPNGEIIISLKPIWGGENFVQENRLPAGIKNGGPINEGVLIAVQDNGSGICEEDIPHVFERFYKGRNSDQAESYGIGLAIAKEIVAIHNGSIWVESKVGQGSTFYIKLPVALPATA